MKGKKEKKDYDQNIGLHEVFLESVPSALIIFVIWLKAFGTEILMIFVTMSRLDNVVTGGGLDNIIFVDGIFIDGHSEFYITFSLSVFSASLGLAKCLKNGVARPIGDGGCLDGLLSARHLLALIICGICLFARAACLDCLGYVTNPSGQV